MQRPTTLSPLAILRRSEEIDDLERDMERLDKTNLKDILALKKRHYDMLHRLENDLP